MPPSDARPSTLSLWLWPIAISAAAFAWDRLLTTRSLGPTPYILAVLLAAWHSNRSVLLAVTVFGSLAMAFREFSGASAGNLWLAASRTFGGIGALWGISAVLLSGQSRHRNRAVPEAVTADAAVPEQSASDPPGALLDSMPLAIVLTDLDGKVALANRAAEAMFGWSGAELSGRAIGELLTNSANPPNSDSLTPPPAGNRQWVGRRRDGTFFPADVHDAEAATAEGPRRIHVILNQTARQEEEGALRERLGELAHIVTHLPLRISYVDTDLRYIFNNRGFNEWIGIQQDDVTGLHVSDVVGDELCQRLLPRLQQALEGQSVEFEEVFEGEQGVRYLKVSLVPSYNQEGKVVGTFSLSHDVTELRLAKDRFRAVVESAPSAIVMIDESRDIVLVNAETEALFGYRRDELIGQPLDILVPERSRPRHHDGLARYFAAPQIARLAGRELNGRRSDGSEFPVEIAVSPIRTTEGMFVLSSILDITERKRSGEYQSRLAAIVESSDDAIIGKTLDGIITSWNDGAAQTFGYTAEEAIGCPLSLLVRVPVSQIEFLLNELRAGRNVHQHETVWSARGGRRVHVMVSMSVIRNEGQVVGASTIARDITDRKLAEEQLQNKSLQFERANRDLSRSNQELDDFAYIASHDLKEPLRGMYNMAGFLREDYGDRLDSDGQSMLQSITRQAERMFALIDSLLEFSRVGRVDLAMEQTDLNAVLEEVLDSLAMQIRTEGVSVRIPAPLPRVLCDRVRVGEIFRNLITNAVKYNDKPDRWVEIGATRPASERGPWLFHVRDNGIGIQQKHLPVVFRIFKRLHERDKFGGGTGAGLTIVKKIVERHRGEIRVESVPGEGTTFYFSLQPWESTESFPGIAPAATILPEPSWKEGGAPSGPPSTDGEAWGKEVGTPSATA